MYVCYSYSYPGASHATAAPVATLPPPTLTAPTVGAPPITDPFLIPVTNPAQVFSPATIPIAVCRKRGSEELMSQHSMVTNGQGLSPGQEVNDAKKVKLDNAISRVLHLRNLPPDVNDTEVVQLGMPFGRMKNVLLLKQKNQGFLEFEDETAANTMVNYYQTCPAKIRDRVIYVQFSKHTELKTDHATSFQNATAQAALQAAQALIVGNGGGDEASKRTTLRVIVENLVYPVTIECLHQIFSKFGKVLKMIIFTKNMSHIDHMFLQKLMEYRNDNDTFQALIQFGDSVSANAAKLSLDGQNIYNGCCTLRIDYSKLSNLNVKYNNDKSRDFTNPNLPSGDPNMDQAMHFGAGAAGVMLTTVPGLGPTPLTAYGAPGVGGTPQLYGPGMGLAGNMPMAGFGIPNAAMNAAQARLLPGMGGAQMGSSVLLVSNLDEQKVNPDALFTLFGVYGDVHRVKILFNKKDNALIQMAEPHQAQLAIAHLDKLKLWGKNIRVTQSKHSQVQMPKDGQPDAGLTKDFVSSPLHRFKRPGSKNCQNIYPPSAVLHLSNIPPSVTEEQLTEGFGEHGDVKGFKFFAKDRKMALIQMGTVEEAVQALIAMHNYPLSDSNHLRVSFSKSTL